MNLRNGVKEPPKKKRGRPPTTYRLTAKGFLCATLIAHPDMPGEKLYDELEAWAKRCLEADKDDGIPALVFDGAGGIVVGVKKNEN